MKFLNELNITIEHFINKELINPELIIKNLKIKDLEINKNKDIRSQIYYNVRWTNYNPIINDSNFNNFKMFLDDTNFKRYQNVLNFDKYYDFILNEYIKYAHEEKKISLDFLKKYTSKSPKYTLELIKQNPKELEKNKKQIEKIILMNLNVAAEYAREVLKDRFPEFEEKISNFKINDPEITFYLKNVIVELISKESSEDNKRKKITKFYNESKLFRTALEHYVNDHNSNYKSFFDFRYWVEEVEDIVIKNENSLRNYIFSTYYSRNKDIKEKFPPQLIKQFLKKINQEPDKIYIYYRMRFEDLKDNPEAIEVLKTDPNFFTGFISDIFSRKEINTFEEIEKFSPGYQKIVSKADNLEFIEMFFYMISKIIYKGETIYHLKKRSNLYDQYKEYVYNNYPGLVEKISKDPDKAFNFAESIRAPFKEGESAIFSNPTIKLRYLYLIKSLGPKLVPDYDSYEFPQEENNQHDDYEDYNDYEDEEEY
jgi:hypothetical protein